MGGWSPVLFPCCIKSVLPNTMVSIANTTTGFPSAVYALGESGGQDPSRVDPRAAPVSGSWEGAILVDWSHHVAALACKLVSNRISQVFTPLALQHPSPPHFESFPCPVNLPPASPSLRKWPVWSVGDATKVTTSGY